MEGIVIWIVIIVGWAILKGIFSSGGDNNAISREQFDQIIDQMQGSGRGLPRPIRGNGQGGAFPGRKTAGVAGMPPKGRGRY